MTSLPLLEQLRRAQTWPGDLLAQAAREIERLQAQLDAARTAPPTLDALVLAHRGWPDDLRARLSINDLRRMTEEKPHE